MKPIEFIETAARLLERDPSEADQRSAISRAYYGAFHACIECLPDEFRPDRSAAREGGSHKAIIDAVVLWGRSTRPGRSDAQHAARRIAQLKRSRVVADYHLQIDYVLEASVCIADARTVLDAVERGRRRYDESTTK